MKLKEVLEVYNNELYIRQGLKLGVSGSGHVFHKHLTSDPIPTELLEREVKTINVSPANRYGRPDAIMEVILKGFVEYEWEN